MEFEKARTVPSGGYADRLRLEPGRVYAVRGWYTEPGGRRRKDLKAVVVVEEVVPGGWLVIRWRRLDP